MFSNKLKSKLSVEIDNNLSTLKTNALKIKIVEEKPSQNRKQVVNGTRISSVVAATLFLTNKFKKQQPHKKTW